MAADEPCPAGDEVSSYFAIHSVELSQVHPLTTRSFNSFLATLQFFQNSSIFNKFAQFDDTPNTFSI